jgi:poly-beta-1,6-N-acetyl-D-glucosamine synthase
MDLSVFEAVLSHLYYTTAKDSFFDFMLLFMPFVLLIELPFQLLIFFNVLYWFIRKKLTPKITEPYYPKISVILTCYSEGKDVGIALNSLAEQLYPGFIEIFAMIDGAKKNYITYQTAKMFVKKFDKIPKKKLIVVPKWQRGGRVSSLNTALKLSTGEIILVLDGDSSCDNDLLAKATQHFLNKNTMAVTGSLRVRNAKKSLVTRFQALEYMFAIQTAKVGLSEMNTVNNISGAFGIFRKSFLLKVSGWDSGTAEDLDLTFRMKSYFGKHPELKIKFDPALIVHTDGPTTWRGFLQQRERWEGDLYYIMIRKHRASLRPSIIGWMNLIIIIWDGLLMQLVFPIMIIAYMSYFIYAYPGIYVTTILILLYAYYLFTTLLLYLEHVFLVSERKKYDLSFIGFVPLMPFYNMISRFWAGISIIKEILFKTHKDTSMAPWWVIRKSKY